MAEPAQPSAAQVEEFLRAHPQFLADHPGLYRALAPPLRVHGEILADHMTAMVRNAREHASAMAERADDVLAAGRASAGLAARVQEAVLALMRAQDRTDCIAAELPSLLAVDGVALCAEGEMPGARPLPAGAVARLLGGRQAVFRDGGPDVALLHGEAARLVGHEALVQVPGQGPPALLALVVRDGDCLNPAQGAGPLAFLGRAVAAALGR